jgi:hypothetical protein
VTRNIPFELTVFKLSKSSTGTSTNARNSSTSIWDCKSKYPGLSASQQKTYPSRINAIVDATKLANDTFNHRLDRARIGNINLQGQRAVVRVDGILLALLGALFRFSSGTRREGYASDPRLGKGKRRLLSNSPTSLPISMIHSLVTFQEVSGHLPRQSRRTRSENYLPWPVGFLLVLEGYSRDTGPFALPLLLRRLPRDDQAFNLCATSQGRWPSSGPPRV